MVFLPKIFLFTKTTTNISSKFRFFQYMNQKLARFKSSNNLFKINGETDEKTMDGREVKTSYSWDGDTLKGVQKWDGKETTLQWAANGDKLTCVRKNCYFEVILKLRKNCQFEPIKTFFFENCQFEAILKIKKSANLKAFKFFRKLPI